MERVFLLVYLCLAFSCLDIGAVYVKDPTLCSRSKCSATPDRLAKFKYLEGVIYRYAYNIDVSTNLGEKPNQRRNESTLQIDAVVSLSFTSPCEGHLKLSEASLSPNRSTYDAEFPDRAGAEFKRSVEQYSLRFAFLDGKVREVCPHPEEPVWALNFKKGILSLFQNTMKRFDVDHASRELDVNGICETEYKLHEAKKTSLIVKKTKNIPSCTNRYKYLSFLQSTSYRSPFSSNSEAFLEPLLKSWNECEITIDHNIYEQVKCTESHLLKPLSNGQQTGARTDTRASLRLIEESSDFVDIGESEGDDFELSRRVDLLYNHAVAPKPTHGELRMSRDCIKNMCRMGAGEEIEQEFSEMFSKLIHSTRLLNYPSLAQLLHRANSICRTGRKHIINALPYIGSNAALTVQKDLIIKKQIQLDKVKDWVTGFALIPRPDRDTLSALAPLLQHQDKMGDSQFDLSYSAVIHAFCRTLNDDCLRVEPVAQFLRHVELKVEKGCAKKKQSDREIKQTLEALKSIGNMGLETESLREKLKECVEGAGGFLSTETRVAGIDAHRRLPSCDETRDDYFLNLYRNFTQDTELRIASYLQVMRCPDYSVIKLIKHTLKEEEVNQVGSFVWSHLTNLLKSSSPSRIEIQSLLTDRDLGMKFNSDFRKFSRNYETSFFSDEYNLGANYQTNLIFSPSSYVPRTATVNATVDVFGESVNAFEVAVRLEGMEFYAENFFGPDGPLSSEKVGAHFRSFLRSLRSAENEKEDYAGGVKRLPNVIDNNFDNPRISLALKVFGNDLQYVVLNGDKEIRETLASLDPWTKFKQILSGKEVRYEKTSMFLDSSYVIPTSAGLPLRLGASGSAACNFKMSGSLDSQRLSSDGKVEVIGNIMPSVSVDITGTMVVDAFYKSAGIKLRSNLYTSGAVRAHLNVDGLQLVSLNVGLPNEKIEVFSALTDVLFVSSNGANSEETPVGLIVAGKDPRDVKQSNLVRVVSNRTCSWPVIDRLIGLKLCTDYQFSNVTKNPNASYFVLNGPTLFKVSLIKADPTAKSYLLEYKWHRDEDQSIIKVAFDTPGSKIKRELSAEISFDAKSRNVSVVLRAAGSLLLAKGTYRRTDDETMIDLGLDINGTKHLDASAGYTRTDGHHGYNYNPKLYLAINNERVAELSGTILTSEKSNVSQNDIDLLFETKKVWSRVVGYIIRRNASIAANIKVEYRLEGTPGSPSRRNETVQLEVSLSDRSQKSLTHKAANLRLESSAYPHLNVVMAAWYRQALGHLEIHTEINSSPHLHDDQHKFTAQLVLTNSRNYLQNEGAKISAYVALTKPIQKLDIKVGINHFSQGPDTKTHGLIRYAPGKEIMLILDMKMPRGALFDIEAHVNLTVPTFNPMLIDVEIKEKSRNEYDLNLAGTWFSGHNITARGTYVDRSTLSIAHHTIKLLLKSPSLPADVILNWKVYLDAGEVRIDLQMEQLNKDLIPGETNPRLQESNQNKYALVVQHSSLTPTKFLSYLECRYRSNVYSLTAKVDKEREARLEIHLDDWRDVHFVVRGIDEPRKTEAGVEVKWDANRDPDLKFATSFRCLRFTSVAENNVSTTVMVTYPGRLVTGAWLLAHRGRNNYVSDLRLEWSPTMSVHFTIDADYNMQPRNKIFKIEAQLLSPFELWKRTSLNARYLQNKNAITASSSVYWQDSQHVIIELSGDLSDDNETLEWHGNCGLVSTIHPVKWITGNLTHKQAYGRTADTHLSIKYHPDKIVDLKSSWELTRDKDGSFNVSGILNMISPLASYERGDVTSSLRFTPDWKIWGAIYVDLDKRKYTGNLVGDLARLKESMINFNLTTPIERFSSLRGKLGFSEKNRHVVARIDGPQGAVGVEALFQLFTQGTDFNVKLEVATPIELLQRSLLVAKLSRKEADFRVGYNNLTAGFQGVWRYLNLTDFHYTYIVYTPLGGFEECGVVAKLVLNSDPEASRVHIDTEFSLRLSDTKIGIAAVAGPKPPPFVIPIKSEPVTSPPEEDEYGDDYPEEDYELVPKAPLYWQGEILIDLAIFDTIVGNLDIDQDDSLYKILGTLKIPPGAIRIDDRFYIRDYLMMTNDLKIDTPFEFGSEITSAYKFCMDMEKRVYVAGTDLRIKNHSDWIETGYSVEYEPRSVEDLKIHPVKISVKSPLGFLPYLDININVETEENTYKAKVDVTGENCLVDLSGSYETEEGFLDSFLLAKVNSPLIVVPRTKIILRKDFTSQENRLEFGVEVYEPVLKVFNLHGVWLVKGNDFVNASLGLKSPIEMLENIEAKVYHVNSISKNDSAELNLELVLRSVAKYKFDGDYRNGIIDVKVFSPIRNYESLEFLGNVEKSGGESLRFNGDLTNARSSDKYKVSGEVRASGNTISTLKATILPELGSKGMTLNFDREVHGFKFWTEDSPRDIFVYLNYVNLLNWNAQGKIHARDRERVDYLLTADVDTQVNGKFSVYLSGKTPWKSLDNFMVSGNMLLSKLAGSVLTNHQFNEDSSSFELKWNLQYMEDMLGKMILDYEIDGAKKRVDTQLFYKNPRKSFRNLNTGFDVNIDRELWRFGSNVTVGVGSQNHVDAILSVTLPPPDKDRHTVLISYHPQTKTNDFNYAVGYSTEISRVNYASDGSLKKDAKDINGHLRVTWGLSSSQTVNNLFNVTFQSDEISLDYSLFTPKFLQEETLVLRLNYNTGDTTHSVLNADVYYPSTNQVGNARILYASLANVNGSVNASTPFPDLDYVGCNFVVYTTIKQNKRFVEAFWPKHTALLDSDYSYHSERLDSSLEGVLRVEIPLNTRHVGVLTYGYKKRPQITVGHSELTYNKEKIVHGEYSSRSESRAGFEKDRIEITIQNSYKPIGILYVNQYEYSAGNEGTNYPTVESKQVNIYRLGNSSEFNVAGESRIRTTHSGQDIDLKAIHFNRTVQLRTNYKILPGEFDHNSRLSLAKDAWVSYRVNILNRTTDEVENQFLILNFAYPRRNFTLDGSYLINGSDFGSEAKLEWDGDRDRPKTIGTGLGWNKATTPELEGLRQAVLSFKHPSFEKDVTFTAKLDQRDPGDLVNVALVVDYSTAPEKLLVLSGKIRDDSVWPTDRKYSYQILGRHPNTFLDLSVNGSLHKYAFVFVKIANYASYQRGYSPVEDGQLLANVDLSKYEIELRRQNKESVKYLKARYYPSHPEYVVNGSIVDTPDLNATGYFSLNVDEKLTWLMLNYTPDAVESLRMYGKIPDARNAVFDIWRTYDQDLVISDVAFYLRLNHSRLVTSTLKWRPDLREDVTSTVKATLNEIYDSIGSDADYWKQYIRSETVNAVSDVWNDAQEELEQFLEDCNDLRELQTDLEDLQLYLNESYNANEFYVRDIVAFGSYLIDELSLRSHIQSLPNIFNEIWDIMGESGLAIRNSLIWAIEAIKAGYNKLSEIATAIMKGDSMSQITTIVGKLVEKYDNFVKDLHVSFIKYMENLWAKMSVAASDQWSKFLKYVEPMFIQVIHYLETVTWKASQEVLDFLYHRTNEIMTSPYFDRFTNFTQDVDKIYRDIRAHDIVTNVRKYSGIIVRFIKERYFTMVPFGKELKNVVDEIVGELQELTKLPSVRYAIDKVNQVYARAKYLYDYFEVGEQINRAIKLIHLKLTDVSQTALQAENRYREAKTKFIFSPQKGLLCLEQKLPMSWHAFNQTPEFQEIAEYRALSDVRSYFVTSNMTFWTLYYQYKPYTEPSSWLPPFKAQAMIAGGQHYMTFDGRYYEFSGECTYLLAQDFVKHQFAVLIKYNVEGGATTHQIIVLIGGKAIQLDVFKNSVKLLDSEQGLQLPAELGDGEAYVYQEETIVVVESRRQLFRLECNMKFDICILELSGWYYGKTAGLFGTMSNEQADDFLDSRGKVTNEVGEFAHSWSVDKRRCTGSGNGAFVKPPKAGESETCEELFANKSSEFNSCFNIVDPNPFRTMCSNSRSENEACTAAVAYIQVCSIRNTYLRIPDKCTRCSLVNGTEVREGEFRKLEGNSVPKSSDVVFIVEAKRCNEDIKKNISLELLLGQLNKEFNALHLLNLRWSLVTFGGDGVYDEPRSLVINGETFVKDHRHFISYFDHIPIGNGNQDIFAALRHASQLAFRSGVSKTFILLPCSHCEPENQTLDYSVLHQVLLEHDTTLHVLMDADFQLEKAREGRFLYGLDAGNSYTRKDVRELTGDKDLRRQIKLSKNILGYCMPLALETNGTVFSGRKLRLEKPIAVKKIANVFSKRVAAGATPSDCQHCECIADNNGVTKMECIPCVYPTPVIIDYEGFNEDESLAVLQPFDFDYAQTDLEGE